MNGWMNECMHFQQPSKAYFLQINNGNPAKCKSVSYEYIPSYAAAYMPQWKRQKTVFLIQAVVFQLFEIQIKLERR
jgi:hypothetical protein